METHSLYHMTCFYMEELHQKIYDAEHTPMFIRAQIFLIPFYLQAVQIL
jgi:hypothetical protein